MYIPFTTLLFYPFSFLSISHTLLKQHPLFKDHMSTVAVLILHIRQHRSNDVRPDLQVVVTMDYSGSHMNLISDINEKGHMSSSMMIIRIIIRRNWRRRIVKCNLRGNL